MQTHSSDFPGASARGFGLERTVVTCTGEVALTESALTFKGNSHGLEGRDHLFPLTFH